MSFFTFFLYLVCVFIRPQDWMPAFSGKPLINILGIATIIFLIFESSGKSEGRRMVKAPQTWMMLCFFLTILMSHVTHMYFWGMQDSFAKFFPTFILFFVILNAINTERRLKATITIITLIMGLLVMQGIYQMHNGFGWAGQVLTTQGDGQGGIISRINWVGIFGDPNDLALTFVIGIGFLLPFVFSNINILTRLLSAAFVAYLGYGIFLTNSRGGQIALMAAAGYFFIRKTKRFVLGGILGGAAAAAVLVFGPSRMSALSSSEDSAAARLDLWYGGLQLFKSNPIFGRGFGMFMEDLPQTAHNSYVLAVAELGFVGLFLWIAMIYISMKGLLMVQNKNKDLANYALGIQTALFGFCVAAFFLSRTYVILPYMLFAMAGSLVWLSAKSDDKSTQIAFDGKDVRNVFLLSVAVILAVVFMIRGR
ncbi:MAG: O-antigen ligase family protein [Candidatus Omnitrophica bacterium]|nr:O-antigen ligase family protein [Candidatus Omnitrophota bacterium]